MAAGIDHSATPGWTLCFSARAGPARVEVLQYCGVVYQFVFLRSLQALILALVLVASVCLYHRQTSFIVESPRLGRRTTLLTMILLITGSAAPLVEASWCLLRPGGPPNPPLWSGIFSGSFPGPLMVLLWASAELLLALWMLKAWKNACRLESAAGAGSTIDPRLDDVVEEGTTEMTAIMRQTLDNRDEDSSVEGHGLGTEGAAPSSRPEVSGLTSNPGDLGLTVALSAGEASADQITVPDQERQVRQEASPRSGPPPTAAIAGFTALFFIIWNDLKPDSSVKGACTVLQALGSFARMSFLLPQILSAFHELESVWCFDVAFPFGMTLIHTLEAFLIKGKASPLDPGVNVASIVVAWVFLIVFYSFAGGRSVRP